MRTALRAALDRAGPLGVQAVAPVLSGLRPQPLQLAAARWWDSALRTEPSSRVTRGAGAARRHRSPRRAIALPIGADPLPGAGRCVHRPASAAHGARAHRGAGAYRLPLARLDSAPDAIGAGQRSGSIRTMIGAAPSGLLVPRRQQPAPRGCLSRCPFRTAPSCTWAAISRLRSTPGWARRLSRRAGGCDPARSPPGGASGLDGSAPGVSCAARPALRSAQDAVQPWSSAVRPLLGGDPSIPLPFLLHARGTE